MKLTNFDEFGKTVRTLRKTKGLTMAELAKACGVTLKAVSNWEHYNVIPRKPEVKRKLFETLGIEDNGLSEEKKVKKYKITIYLEIEEV